MKKLFLIPLLALAGCTTTREITPEPIVVVQEVIVPGPPVPCVPRNIGDAPAYVDSKEALLSASEGAVRYQLLIAGRAQREARLSELEPVVRGCPKVK